MMVEHYVTQCLASRSNDYEVNLVKHALVEVCSSLHLDAGHQIALKPFLAWYFLGLKISCAEVRTVVRCVVRM